MKKSPPTSSTRRLSIHALRVLLFVAIILLIHLQYKKLITHQAPSQLSDINLTQIQAFIPEATSLSNTSNQSGALDILGDDDQSIGYILQTSPEGDRSVGFSGPTNLLMIFGTRDQLKGLQILSSADTPAHVQQVEEDEDFLNAFIGHSTRELASLPIVDGVSGATLTALAIQESIMTRLGATKTSIRFPEPISLSQAQLFFPEASRLEQNTAYPSLWSVFDKNQHAIGSLLRTSPTADSTIGYQGPTDCLIAIDEHSKIKGILLGKTFDNEEYVDYIRKDDYFLNLFNDHTTQSLSQLDLEEAEVEGVSGATMTSIAIARGLILAAQDEERFQVNASSTNNMRWKKWARHDLGTALIILLAIIIGMTRLRGHKLLRIGFPILLIIYLGLINGDILSQAMIMGWTRHGIPWSLTPGLIILSAAAFLLPITTRNNIYCHHICPHGAAQQLLRKIPNKKYHLSARVQRTLKFFPGFLFAICVLITMTSTTFSLVDLEPFDAWVFQVAGWATLSIAIIGLFASLFIPMAYCKFGCPTGFLLNFLRLNAHSDRWGKTDAAAVMLLIITLCIWQLT